MDNQKIDSNYIVTSEAAGYPFTNATDSIRSRLYRSTSNSAWRLALDLGFQDRINAVCIFAALGESLGITREATVKLEADNVLDWSSPDLSLTIPVNSDDRIVYFPDDSLELNYRFWSLYIDDPTNPNAYIEFAHIYMGDYTSTEFRNVSNGFAWQTVDATSVQKSLNGTAYFDIKTKYDRFSNLQFGLCADADRQTLENLYDRSGIYTWMPISIDPEGKTVGDDIEKLTRLARFAGNFDRGHQIAGYYNVSFSLEEVI